MARTAKSNAQRFFQWEKFLLVFSFSKETMVIKCHRLLHCTIFRYQSYRCLNLNPDPWPFPATLTLTIKAFRSKFIGRTWVFLKFDELFQATTTLGPPKTVKLYVTFPTQVG